MLEAALDNLRQAIRIDISTGDIITPGAVAYSYNLMFEDRAISLWTYNLETLLAEKLETIMARGTANTRMRDFYDIHHDRRNGKILTPDGLRFICEANGYDPERQESIFLKFCRRYCRKILNHTVSQTCQRAGRAGVARY